MKGNCSLNIDYFSPTYLSFNKTFNAVVDSVDGITAIDTVSNKRADRSIHSATLCIRKQLMIKIKFKLCNFLPWCSNVYHSQRVATLYFNLISISI